MATQGAGTGQASARRRTPAPAVTKAADQQTAASEPTAATVTAPVGPADPEPQAEHHARTSSPRWTTVAVPVPVLRLPLPALPLPRVTVPPLAMPHIRLPHISLSQVRAELPEAATNAVGAAARTVRDTAARLPVPRRLAYYGALGALAVAGALEWPVAAAIGAGVWVASQDDQKSGTASSDAGSSQQTPPPAHTG